MLSPRALELGDEERVGWGNCHAAYPEKDCAAFFLTLAAHFVDHPFRDLDRKVTSFPQGKGGLERNHRMSICR